MSQSDIKQHLLSYNIFVNNDFLEKYSELVYNRKYCCPLAPSASHSHHIVPVMYYKHNSLDIDNTPENKVSLTYAEHVIAHWYMANCSSESYLYYGNLSAVDFVMHVLCIPVEEFVLSVEEQELYNNHIQELRIHQSERMQGENNPHWGIHTNYGGSSRGYKFNKEQVARLSVSHRGKPSCRKGCKLEQSHIDALREGRQLFYQNLSSEELKNVYAKQWETRRANGTTHTTNGMHIYNNGIVETRAFSCPDGFVEGSLLENIEKRVKTQKETWKNKSPEQKAIEQAKRLQTRSNRTAEQKQQESDRKSVASKKLWEERTPQQKENWVKEQSQKLVSYHARMSPEDKEDLRKKNSQGQRGKLRYVSSTTGKHKMFFPDEQPDGWHLVEFVHCWNIQLNKRVRIARENFDPTIHKNIEEDMKHEGQTCK